MHVLFRETRSLDEAAAAVDLAQTPGEIVLLSFADSDLGAAAAAWQAAGGTLPTMRLANLAKLRHPLSVDLYVSSIVTHAKCVIVRLLGGIDYWRYGVEEVATVCSTQGTALVLLPGDGRPDSRLAELSTVTRDWWERFDALLRQGGATNLGRALRLAAHIAHGEVDAYEPAEPIAAAGMHPLAIADGPGRALAAIVFYRAHLVAGDIAPITAIAAALQREGLNVRALYVSSLKDRGEAAFVADTLRALHPAVIVNATGFSARLEERASPLEAAGAPVLQLVMASSARSEWASSARGLAPADLAMQVVLPELDGRLLMPAVSFKTETAPVAGLEYTRVVHQPEPDGIRAAAARAAGWARLAATPERERRVALILSDYPGAGGQVAHAVGLDAIASAAEVLRLLNAGVVPDLGDALCNGAPQAVLTVADYAPLFATLPADSQRAVTAAWGAPADDPAVQDAAFHLRFTRAGRVVVAIQPDRGSVLDRRAGYHDPAVPPRHAYVAFYLWLRAVEGVHAIIHMGTHGTLEWLPGKAVALSAACFPQALIGSLPVIYPFIVNNPGEAAAAKRRLGAVTIGHLTPPLRAAGTHGAAVDLERLIDEFAAADGLDARRTSLLRREILLRANASGVLAEIGAGADVPEDVQLARLDAYLCDVKDLQIRDGLHVFGQAPDGERRARLLEALVAANPGVSAAGLETRLDGCAAAERNALLAALSGRFVAPGPAGAPTRGRADVLPTGRNLFTVDPRAVPTRSAMVLAERAAAEILRRHRQDHGDWPRSMVIDLWGSATMRTGGEDFALGLVLMGARPVWDTGSNRVTGIEVVPTSVLGRPRVDVSLRISGLFRDAFETQITLFDSAVRAIAALNEPGANPLAEAVRGLGAAAMRRATARVFGAAPTTYGTGIEDQLDRGAFADSAELGAAYLAGSAHSYGLDLDGKRDEAGFAARVAAADAFVHVQDHREIDLLDSVDFAAHEGGFAAAARRLGGSPALYHADTAQVDKPVARTVAEEVARVVRGRVANPAWIAGMMRHGYRGGAEIARGLDGLFAFAATLPQRLDPQFDLVFDATLGDEAVDQFLRDANPAARAAIADRFRDALRRDLWRPRRNSIANQLGAA